MFISSRLNIVRFLPLLFNLFKKAILDIMSFHPSVFNNNLPKKNIVLDSKSRGKNR